MSNLFNEEEFLNATGVQYVEKVRKDVLWTRYDFNKISSRPPKYGKYFVVRKDGKEHWEVWNGTSWAYNENSIVWWAKIELP